MAGDMYQRKAQLERSDHVRFCEGVVQKKPSGQEANFERALGADDAMEFVWDCGQRPHVTTWLGYSHGERLPGSDHWGVLQLADAGLRENLVPIFFYQVGFSIVESSHGDVAQDIVKRPHQSLRAVGIQVLLNRTDQDPVQLLGGGQRIFISRAEHFPEFEDLVANLVSRDRALTSHLRIRCDHEHENAFRRHEGVKSYRARLQSLQDRLHVTGISL